MPIPARRQGQLNIDQEFSFSAKNVELPIQEFIYKQGVSGILLLLAAVLALLWANSPWSSVYFKFWDAKLSFEFGFVHLDKSLHHWINDGFMALFFFLVGMEIKHEMVHGHLSSLKRAALPIIAASGGMIVPALLFVCLNAGQPTVRGWGIPMATDIAFAVGVMALIPGISQELKIFLLALAIVDDLGAILVIALFYTEKISIVPLVLGALVLAGIQGLRLLKVGFGFPYVLLGILFWYAILKSGIHATIAGVMLAFLVSSRAPLPRTSFEEKAQPILDDFRDAMSERDVNSADASLGAIEALAVSTDPPIERLTRALHPWVAFVVLPLFAFANSGVTFSAGAMSHAFRSPILWGVVVGLVIGKPLGIVLFSLASSRLKIAELPTAISVRQLTGAGILAGIGFTVAIFIGDLAFLDDTLVNIAKTGILLASAISGIIGYLWLRGVPLPAGITVPLED